MTYYTENIQETLQNTLGKTSKNIGIVTHCFPPDFGAAPHQFEFLAQSFSKKGNKVTVFTSHPYYPTGKITLKDFFTWKRTSKEKNITVIRHWLLPSQKNNMFLRLISMFSMLFSMFTSLREVKKQKLDILLIQTPPITLPIFGILAKKLYGVNVVLNVSDLWPQAMVDINGLSKSSVAYKVLHWLEKFYYKKADALVTQSKESQEYIKDLGFDLPHIYRIGANTKQFRQKTDFNSTEKIKVVYMGVLGVAHGISKLIKEIAFDDLNIELHIFGDGVDYKNIQSIIKKKQLNNVFLNRAIDYHLVPQTLRQFDIALISQINYVKGTLPAKLYESMSVGLPIIYHGEGEGAEIVKYFNCGWTSNPSDYDALTKNFSLIHKLKTHELKEKGQNARTACIEHFDLHQQFDQLDHLLSSIVVQMA
ncbi:glycosyltransferase family 4 protein [Flammeovirga sp. MY04]|uniref:glycosyltransferase family 4 protein n=1 Tax=Flammeovirga sp. MY04 TaxID=1191459 RepID=UPI0008062E41|nr:glycosyltransferase family 4 protein [Flammeovirga sp. MY04]ANQ48209.1 glycosyltransferase family 4 protein [Flammeovirga sp. MY04]